MKVYGKRFNDFIAQYIYIKINIQYCFQVLYFHFLPNRSKHFLNTCESSLSRPQNSGSSTSGGGGGTSGSVVGGLHLHSKTCYQSNQRHGF